MKQVDESTYVSIFRKVCPCSPVVTMSWMVDTTHPALARRKVPGSISRCSLRPVSSANALNASTTCGQGARALMVAIEGRLGGTASVYKKISKMRNTSLKKNLLMFTSFLRRTA